MSQKTKVTKTRILGTNCTVYAAWEYVPNQSYINCQHSTLMTIDGELYGKISTRHLDAKTNKIPVGRERSEKVFAHYEANYNESYALIIAQYPEATNGLRDMGEIEICTA